MKSKTAMRTPSKKLMRKGGVAGLGVGALGLGISPFLSGDDDKKKKARAKEALMRKKMALDKRQTMKRRQMESNEAGVLSREELIKRHRAKQKAGKGRRPAGAALIAAKVLGGVLGAGALGTGMYLANKNSDKEMKRRQRKAEENRKKRKEKRGKKKAR